MPGLNDLKELYVTPETLDEQLAQWRAEVAPYQWRPVPPLHLREAALLVVDMNRPFVEPDRPLAVPSAVAIVPRIAQAVAAFRQARRPVLWLVQGHHSLEHDRGAHLAGWWPAMICEGTPDVALPAGLEPLPAEKVILKRRYSGFYQTDLELTLRCLGVTQVVIAGVLTNVCPYATAVDAFMRDLDVYYLADGTAAPNRELHVGALRNVAAWCGSVVTVAQVGEWLEGTG
jgi:nicotinamidase-related amidase